MKFPYKFIKKTALDNWQKNYNQVLLSKHTATRFIKEIENGNLAIDSLKDADTHDELIQALLAMQQQLQKIALQEKQRNWATHGIALFADILRSDNSDSSLFYHKIIANLVKYMEANQGGLFLINEDGDDKPCLELVSCYAYDRQKFTKKTLQPGEGLAGQCYLEKQTILLTEIPQNYLKITSGLGIANPSCIAIVPLKVNEEIHGVIELASFTRFKSFQVEFLEKLGESIASTVSNVKINHKTRKLLQASLQQAEELKAQEEEMRQNMEELNATQENQFRLQEELRNSEEELKTQLSALQEAREETERVRQLEQTRANERIEAQKKSTEKLMLKFKETENSLKDQIRQLAEELNLLKSRS
jgi:hypothetical protein